MPVAWDWDLWWWELFWWSLPERSKSAPPRSWRAASGSWRARCRTSRKCERTRSGGKEARRIFSSCTWLQTVEIYNILSGCTKLAQCFLLLMMEFRKKIGRNTLRNFIAFSKCVPTFLNLNHLDDLFPFFYL